MAVDATGTPTSLGIPKFNTAVDAPSGKGANAQMDAIDTLIAATPQKPSGLAAGEFMVSNGTTFDRSTVTRPDPTSLGTGTPDGTKFLKDNGVWTVPTGGVAAGVFLGLQVFTSSGTYTPTAGTTRIYVEAWGGGGAGGGVPAIGSGNVSGGGGGAGAYSAKRIASGFSGVSYIIGAAGAGASNAAGGNGGDTTFNSTAVVAKGGTGGPVGVLNTNVGFGAGGAASGGTGDVKIDGQRGGNGVAGTARSASGTGGASPRGGAGAQNPGESSSQLLNGLAGVTPGGGGGAAQANITGAAGTGGNGGAGLIVIWEFA